MKITLDIPDNTLGIMAVLLCGDWGGLTMHSESIDKNKLIDGAVIVIRPEKGGKE